MVELALNCISEIFLADFSWMLSVSLSSVCHITLAVLWLYAPRSCWDTCLPQVVRPSWNLQAWLEGCFCHQGMAEWLSRWRFSRHSPWLLWRVATDAQAEAAFSPGDRILNSTCSVQIGHTVNIPGGAPQGPANCNGVGWVEAPSQMHSSGPICCKFLQSPAGVLF